MNGKSLQSDRSMNIFGKFHRARLELHSSNWNPRSRVGARAAHSCSGLIAVEAAGRWLLLLGDPKK